MGFQLKKMDGWLEGWMDELFIWKDGFIRWEHDVIAIVILLEFKVWEWNCASLYCREWKIKNFPESLILLDFGLNYNLGLANEKHSVNLEFATLALYPKLHLNFLIPLSQLKSAFLDSTFVAVASRLLNFLTVLEVASPLEGQWWDALDSFLDS